MDSRTERQSIWLPAVSFAWRGRIDVTSKPKLRSYIKLKADCGETEGYVQRTRVKVHRSLLANLKGGVAPLQIEIGRYVCLPVEERSCKTCNSGMVEDEEHFCVGCPGVKET